MEDEFEKEGEETPETTPEEGDTSEKHEGEAAKSVGKSPYWRVKANAMYARYKSAEEKIKELEAKLAEMEKPNWRQKVEFLLEHKDYSEEEFNHIATVAKEFDISLEEAAELEKDYIQYRREKVAKEKQQLEPSTRTSPSQIPIEETPVEKLKELTPEQREEWYRKHGIKRR